MVYYVGNSMMARGMRACRESRGFNNCDECRSCGSSEEEATPVRESREYQVNPETGQVKKKMTYYAYDFPTERQISALKFITMFTGKIFDGKTKEMARRFISEHMDDAIKQKERYEWY